MPPRTISKVQATPARIAPAKPAVRSQRHLTGVSSLLRKPMNTAIGSTIRMPNLTLYRLPWTCKTSSGRWPE